MDIFGMPQGMMGAVGVGMPPMIEDSTYTIYLSDGTVLDDLKMNGNNYVTDKHITKEMFTGNMQPVLITQHIGSHNYENEHKYMDLVHFRYDEQEKKYYFVLADISEREHQIREMLANVDYLLMMQDE